MVNDGTTRMRTPGAQRRRRAAPEVRDPVEVMCRLRPLPSGQEESCVTVVGETTLRLSPPEQSRAYNNSKDIEYTFAHVIDESVTQSALFRQVGLPLVDDLVRGRNGLLFTYGITGSGKTYTMTGSPRDGGMLPRCLDALFNSVGEFQAKKYVFKPDKANGFDVQSEVDAMLERQQREIMPQQPFASRTPRREAESIDRVADPSKIEDVDEDSAFAVFVSYCEIYNNYVYDLLEDPTLDTLGRPKAPQSRKLREDAAKVMYVENLTETEVKSTEEAYEALMKGDRNRRRAQTVLNHESSRSHSVFNVRLVQGPLDPAGEDVLLDKNQVAVSQLSLVDLAGSERQDRTKAAGDRLKEAGQINNSLMTLRACMETLRENQQSGAGKMVPYRDSRITHLFKNFFEGEGKVKMIVCVNPMAGDYDETLHVMKFAEMTQEVKTARAAVSKLNQLKLTPGRRRAAVACKRALEECAAGESGGSLTDDETPPSPLVYDLGPPLPVVAFDDPADEAFFPNLIDYFQAKLQRRAALRTDLQRRYDVFRSQLVEIEQENTALRTQVTELQAAVQARDKEVSRLKRRLQHAEASSTALKKTHAEAVLAKKDLESELETKAAKIRQERDARRRLQEEMASKMALWEKHMSSKHAQEMRKQATKHEAEKRAQGQRLLALKEIINLENPQALLFEADSGGSGAATAAASSCGAAVNDAGAASSSSHVKNLVSSFEPRVVVSSSSSESLPSSSSSNTHPKRLVSGASASARSRVAAASAGRATSSTSSVARSRVAASQRSKSPPPSTVVGAGEASRSALPVGGPSRRRSRSQGNNVWLDHRPAPPPEVADAGAATDSILRPKIPSGEKRVSRKSLTRIEAKDAEKATKYVLTTQRVDSEGEVETQVYKGDVFPTRGGGSEVKMTELEIHRQRRFSPGAKRSYSASREPEDDAVDEVESRCNIAIEGHAHNGGGGATKSRKN